MAFKKDIHIKNDFSSMTISLASPESILERSMGEVTKPETINYRTYKPERDGLFCERIFGPVRDWECHCGKYKRIRYKGIVCDRCGVEVTEKKVRRERMGHISLVVPVAHIWFFRSLPNKIGTLLDIPSKKLEQVIYYEKYVVIQPRCAANLEFPIKRLDLLTEEEYYNIVDQLPEGATQLEDTDPNKFVAMMGAEALEILLKDLDLDNPENYCKYLEKYYGCSGVNSSAPKQEETPEDPFDCIQDLSDLEFDDDDDDRIGFASRE
jgi:DNA-directed RNA polymerase subunit beta'